MFIVAWPICPAFWLQTMSLIHYKASEEHPITALASCPSRHSHKVGSVCLN